MIGVMVGEWWCTGGRLGAARDGAAPVLSRPCSLGIIAGAWDIVLGLPKQIWSPHAAECKRCGVCA
eukprot:scaffold166163_cov43-Tisochrysis_lutea.AAC.2